jgi:hypothetical protein
LLLVGLTLASASCGQSSLSTAPTCQQQTQSCTDTAAGSYQTCLHADGTVDYNTGAELCTCAPGYPLQCLLCAEIVTGYCRSDPAGGFSDAGSSNCAATFSGAFSGTSSSCVPSIFYAPSADVTSVRVKFAAITGTPYTWGAEFVAPGAMAAGTFQQTQGIEGSIFVTDDSAMLPNWEATINSGAPLGDATLQITTMGPGVQADGQTFYQTAQGTWTASLVDMRSQTAPQPNVTATITF